jgi:uncharacterized protein (TIGR02145 family)
MFRIFLSILFIAASFTVLYSQTTPTPNSPATVIPCSTAQVACSQNVYTFPAGTSGNPPMPVGGYPNYGCMGGGFPPSWFYMQVGVAGDIIIFIHGTHDVDFICWGAFTSLSEGCATGLTASHIVDCSIAPWADETCHIFNAQVGDIYILLLSNFGSQPGIITFQQVSGNGQTNCNIVVDCSMIALTGNPSVCNSATNTFSISGNVEFSNPPATGNLIITDNTAIPPVTQTLSPPFISPLAYNLTDIPCDGTTHSITAAFSDSTTCTITAQVPAPPPSCPVALISGGGEICNNGTSTIPVNINLSGTGPFTFTYAINGTPEPVINNYAGPSPYVVNASVPGTYTLLSVSNAVCTGPGTVSGSASVIVNSLPVPTLIGPPSPCEGSTGNTYSTEPGNSQYQWIVSPGGTITGGGTSGTPDVTVTWNTAGSQSVSVNYHDLKGCIAASPTVYPVTVLSLPTPVISGSNSVCKGSTGVLYSTAPGMSGYNWSVSSGGTITLGGTTTDPTAEVTWNSQGAQSVSVSYTNPEGCTPAAPSIYPVTVHDLPVPTVSGPANPCVGLPGLIYSTQPSMTNYLWSVSPGGTITAGGTASSSDVTVTWTTPGPHTVSVNYQDVNSCTAGVSTVYPVVVNPLPGTPGTISGPSILCQGTMGASYSAGLSSNATSYLWALTPPAAGTINGSTNAITLDWAPAFTGTAALSVQGANSCGNGISSPVYSILVNPKPTVSFTRCNDSITTVNAQPYRLKGGIPSGGTYSGSGVTNGILYPAIAGAGNHLVTYTYSNASACAASSHLTVHILQSPAFVCGNSLSDPRDGKLYPTIQIGTQCWLAGNLNYGTMIPGAISQRDNCIPEKYCFNDITGNCAQGTVNYQWDELMAYDETLSTQGLCPPGWHVPAEAEWNTLFAVYINNGFAASPLKYTGYSGFNALLTGTLHMNRTADWPDFATFFWSSTPYGPTKAWAHGMNEVDPSVSLYPAVRSNAYSVRCLKD